MLDQRVRAVRVATLLKQQPPSLLANLVNSGLVALVLGGDWPLSWLLVWLAAIWALTLLRASFWVAVREGPADAAQADRIASMITVLAITSGLIWGVPGVLIFPAEPIALQGFVVFVLGGMSAGAVATLSSHRPAFIGFVIPALVPIIGRLLFEGGVLYTSMGIMGIVYIAVLLVTGLSLHRTLSDSIALQIEKSDLVESLDSARREAEAASEAKSAFLATVSHELRTPLNAVLGFGQLMESQIHGPLGDERYNEYLRLMRHSGTHLLSLIGELLELSRAQSGHLEIETARVALPDLIQDCILLTEGLADHRDVRLGPHTLEGLPDLEADPRRLRQIILNVLGNAVKFTPADGSVMVEGSRNPSGDLILRVRDTGIGMTEADIATAFEFFGRAETPRVEAVEGAGIGLPFTTLLMSLHDGDLTIDSAPGKGTVVHLRFPAERVIEGAEDGTDRPRGAPCPEMSAGPAA